MKDEMFGYRILQNEEDSPVDKFVDQFVKYSYNNYMYGRLVGHVVLGTILRDMELWVGAMSVDMRTSLFLFQPSGTGKSRPFQFVWTVLKKLGKKVESLDTVTDAGMIGSVVENPRYNPRQPESLQNPPFVTVAGLLETADVVHYDEGATLLQPKRSFDQQVLGYLQTSLNPLGTEINKIHKRQRDGDIIVSPTCSLIITSYMVNEVTEVLLNTGFFQRILVFPKDISRSDRQAVYRQMGLDIGKRTVMEVDIDGVVGSFAKVEAFAQNNKEFIFTEDLVPIWNRCTDAFNRIATTDDPAVTQVMDKFVARYVMYFLTLACHHAAMRGDPRLNKTDLEYSMEVISGILKHILVWMESNRCVANSFSRDKQYEIDVRTMYDRLVKGSPMDVMGDGFVRSSKLVSSLRVKWAKGKPTVVSRLENLEERRVLICEKMGRENFYKVLPEGSGWAQG